MEKIFNNVANTSIQRIYLTKTLKYFCFFDIANIFYSPGSTVIISIVNEDFTGNFDNKAGYNLINYKWADFIWYF